MQSREQKKKRRPAKIDLGDEALTILWQDAHQSRYPLETLRLSCPCASCREKRGKPHGPQLVGNELPLVTNEIVTPTSEANGFSPVGRYGIRIQWADGHDDGIYTFEMLRELADT
jgi:DUF971 family protein